MEKSAENRKITEPDLLAPFQQGAVLLPPLVIRSVATNLWRNRKDRLDACVELALPGESMGFRFVVEAKGQSTPLMVQQAVAQVKTYVENDEFPMITVPYLSPERLTELEREQVSGVDLCGNGVVIVPGRLYVSRTGQPNRYPTSRPLANPYSGRSALVARMILKYPRWDTLKQLVAAIKDAGSEISLGQASKAVQALEEDLIVWKLGNLISLKEPLRLLDKLGNAFEKPVISTRQALRLPQGMDWARALSAKSDLQWVVTGESSVMRYTVFAQGGPRRIAVSRMDLALNLLGGTPERVPSFADLELVETTDPGVYFLNQMDKDGIRWASRLQTWLELQAGDARQQDAAQDLRKQIIMEINNEL